jgi:hypothetical protein
MRRALLVITVVAAALGFGLVASCSFDGGRADEYRCGSGGTCPDGYYCDYGICVATAALQDAGADAPAPTDGPASTDGPVAGDGPLPDAPVTDAPPQQDAVPQDVAPQQDAVQEDAPPQQDAGSGCLFDPLTADLGHFTPVLTAASWQYGAAGYAQSDANDLHLTWVSGSGGDAVSLQVLVQPTAQGQAQFDNPKGNFASVAGVVVRASGLTATNVTGYLCGVDLRGQRLLLGRMQGTYAAGNGDFTVLGQQAMTVALDGHYPVTADAQGTTITCSSGTTTLSVTDATIATGSVGLFTLGARATFSAALYCVP